MEKKFNFVYVTINLVNWKMYIGDHSTDNKILDLYYKGSGDSLKKAIQKYGKENFVRIELEFFDTKKEAFDAQEKYIRLLNTLTPDGYNISPKGGLNVQNSISKRMIKKLIKYNKSRKGIPHTKEHNEKIRKSLIGYKFSDERKKNISKSLLNRKISEETKLKISNSLKGQKRSNEFKEKISKIHKGKILSKETKLKISETLKRIKNDIK